MSLLHQSNVIENADGSIVGWLEKKSRHLGKWRKRWMVLHGGVFTSYKTQNKLAKTEQINLSKYSNVCKSGSLSFDIYNDNKIAFQFRASTYDDKAKWVDHISINILNLKQPSKQSKKSVLFQISGDGKHELDENFIHTNLRLNETKLLKGRFAHSRDNPHPELLIYDKEPIYDLDVVIRIDLITTSSEKDQNNTYNNNNNDDDEQKLNRVRLQGKTWGNMKNRMIDDFEYPIIKSLKEITTFVIKYQNENKIYDKHTNNCRKFIIELCNYLELKYPKAWPFEEAWYQLTGKLYRLNHIQMNLDETYQVIEEEDDCKMDNDEKKEHEEKVSNCDFDELYAQNVLQHYSGQYFVEKCYFQLKGLVSCFIDNDEEIEDGQYKYKLLLIKSDKENTENDRYFYYIFEVSYELLKIIDNSINRMDEIAKNKFEGDNDKAQVFTADIWLTLSRTPPLLQPMECRNALEFYGKYLQVLFSYNKDVVEYISFTLKFPNDLSMLLVSMKE